MASCFRQAIDNCLRCRSHLEKENQEPPFKFRNLLAARKEKHATLQLHFPFESKSVVELHLADWLHLHSTGIWISGDDGTSHQCGGRKTPTPMLSSARKRQSKADLSGSHIRDQTTAPRHPRPPRHDPSSPQPSRIPSSPPTPPHPRPRVHHRRSPRPATRHRATTPGPASPVRCRIRCACHL